MASKHPPRDYAPQPARFGEHAARRLWGPLPEDRLERARSRAAQVQDAAVGQILAGLKAKRFTRKQLKDRTGWGSERLSRYMTGQVPIQLDDLMLLLDAAGIPFASVAWVSTEEQFRERQRLTDIQGYLAGLQQQVGVELAQVHQARDQSLSSSSPPTVRGLPRVR